MRKIRIGMLSVLILFLVLQRPVRCEELKEGELYGKAVCLMDGESGRVLYGKNVHEKLPMASTTKIMTCILALENGHPDDVVTASENAVSKPKVKMDAKAGEEFFLQDLLYALMLNSNNDAAVMIAEHIGGSEQGFADMMNRKAVEIGCRDTYFITANGLDAEDSYGTHSTTAEDLARILRYCIMESPEKEMFLEITRTPSYTFWDCKNTRTFQCTNHNAFLNQMEGALTGKTGFTADAGYCYVGALKKDNKIFIASLLACGWPDNKEYKWADMKKLMEYALEHYRYQEVFDERDLGKVKVADGCAQNTKIGEIPEIEMCYGDVMENMSMVLLMKEDEHIETRFLLPDVIQAPVKKGQQVGKVQYFLKGELIREYPVYVKEKIEKISMPWCMKKIIQAYAV